MKPIAYSTFILGLISSSAFGQSTYTISNTVDTDYRDARIDDTNYDGIGNNSSGGSGGFSGGDQAFLNLGSIGGNLERQGALFFALPDLSGELLESATLRLYLNSVNNDNSGIATLGNLSVFSDTGDNDANVTAPDFNGGVDSGLDLFTVASATGQYHEVNVTSIVASDYALEGATAVSYFRLALDNASSFASATTGNDSYFVLSGDTANFKPELVISTTAAIPEPSVTTAILGLAAIGGALFLRRRK